MFSLGERWNFRFHEATAKCFYGMSVLGRPCVFTHQLIRVVKLLFNTIGGLCKERKPKRPNPEMTKTGNGRN